MCLPLAGRSDCNELQQRSRGCTPGFNAFVPFPDGHNGVFLEGALELMIIEATGVGVSRFSKPRK